VPASSGAKDPAAFRTIGEVSAELGVAQHILRYWESRFPQLKPLQRAGNRRYYRPEDVELVRRIHSLLSHQGYTVRGVQQLLRSKEPLPEPSQLEEDLVGALKRVRAELAAAITDGRSS
jgi:DNA-binding transcriptional MerR regulator